MTRRLYVSDLSTETTDTELMKAFCRFGAVSEARAITDRATGISRGFGFVTFASPEDANNAIAKLNGSELDGKTISVDIAREKRKRNSAQ